MLSSLFARVRNRMFGRRKRISSLDPDEIFLDSSNLPQFDKSQFEGRIEKPIGKRSFLFLASLFLFFGFVILGRLFALQIQDGEVFAKQSEKNRLHHSYLFAQRGVIYDRDGIELAWNSPSEEGDISTREYKAESGLSHILGYIRTPLKDEKGIYYQTEFTGLSGVEQSLDGTLAGTNGLKIVETDVFGHVQSESLLLPPKDGESITLSIDAELTHILHEYIKELAGRVSFTGGAGVIMDVETGEILALTSYPEFDPNVLSKGDDKEKIARYVGDEQKPFLNRAISGLYTPGSIIKPYLAVGALEEGVIDERTRILSTGSISIPHPYMPGTFSVFNDWKAHGEVSMREALAVSSNVYFFEIGGGYKGQRGLGISNIEKYVRLFGIGKLSGINLPSEAEGVVPSPKWKAENFEDGVWRIGDTYNTAIGQYGFQVTPLSMARAVAAVGNDGWLVTPTVVKEDGARKEKLPISEKYIQVVKEGMRLAVTAGTAAGLYLPSVSVAAKTGTAEVGSRKQFVHSWATGFFPYENPRYAFAVIMERGPVANLTGGVFVVRQLFEWVSVNRPEYLQSL